jgi:hypothetical protein
LPKTQDDYRAILARYGEAGELVFTDPKSFGYPEELRQALFATMRKRGDLLPPTPNRTRKEPACKAFVAWCDEFIPARHTSFREALPEVREKIFEDWRKHAFAGWLAELAKEHAIEIHPLPGSETPAK